MHSAWNSSNMIYPFPTGIPFPKYFHAQDLTTNLWGRQRKGSFSPFYRRANMLRKCVWLAPNQNVLKAMNRIPALHAIHYTTLSPGSQCQCIRQDCVITWLERGEARPHVSQRGMGRQTEPPGWVQAEVSSHRLHYIIRRFPFKGQRYTLPLGLLFTE